MESAAKSNGFTKEIGFPKSLLFQCNGNGSNTKLTVQQALCKWYSFFNHDTSLKNANGWLFPGLPQEDLINSLRTDIELVPSILMDEFISGSFIQDKEQYIRIVQALLINLSDCLPSEEDEFRHVCNEIENVVQFIENFFYQQFDRDSRVTKFRKYQFCNCAKLKLEYWKIKLNRSLLLNALQECLTGTLISPEANITFRKISYLKYLLQEIEAATTALSENYVRELFIYNNFNSDCFINYENELIQAEIPKLQTSQQVILFLQSEKERIAKLKMKSGVSFDIHQPSIKKQLFDCVTDKIKQLEFEDRKINGNDLLLDPESKIQTSLSVAKLAVLIRILVADKIIINKTVAPMIRTVAKLFTTLQKDEISFGSLETKYHAPDKATLNMVKEMLQKWAQLTLKL